MDDLAEELIEYLDDYSTREVLESLAQAIFTMKYREDNPEAWVKLGKELEKLAASQTVEDTISW